jgi:tryptophan synthase beta subunit
MYHAKRLSEELGGAQIWLKREEVYTVSSTYTILNDVC